MKRVRNDISLETKLKILRDVGSTKTSKAQIARNYGIAPTTLQTIVKNKERIMAGLSDGEFQPEGKRMRMSTEEDVDRCTYEWMQQMRSKNLPISGPILQEKASEFAKRLNGDRNYINNCGKMKLTIFTAFIHFLKLIS